MAANLTNAQIMTMVGIAPAANRNAIIADLLSEGLDGLKYMTDEEVRDTCTSYAKRTDGPFPVVLTPVQKQRIKSLVLWAKDRDRVGQDLSFPATTSQAEFRSAISESLERDRRRRSQKKEGESYLDSTFNTKLKSASQWEKWLEELNITLCQIIGVRGVPLTYVIRDNDAPNFDAGLPYDEAVINGMTLTGEEFKQDARTVHKIILKNVHEDSDAYTYIKTLIRHRNGRRDMQALRERYSSDATKQAIINKAKNDLQNLCYKNERSFSFEKFSSKLQKAYDELEDNGRAVNNGDIVDGLWKRIQSADIQLYVASLKIEYQRSPRSYKLILQDIAAEVGNATPSGNNFGGGRGVSATYTKSGPCPKKGVHTSDGSVFIGTYGKDQWLSESVKPHHDEIREARSQNNGGQIQSRSQKRNINAVKREKKKLKKLKAQVAATKKVIASGDVDVADDATTSNTNKHDNAGDAFGGKRTKAKEKE